MNLNKEQIKNLLVFLNRVNLQGNEAETFVQLKILLTKELQPEVKLEQGKSK